tara:strand:+ start:563 stop:778 length:216 start_codon:yes stop_codon:yes gene_type:complete
MPRNARSQKTVILELLQSGVKVTPMMALNRCGCFRLAAVINSLRTEGHNITTEMVKSHTGNKYAEYALIQA